MAAKDGRPLLLLPADMAGIAAVYLSVLLCAGSTQQISDIHTCTASYHKLCSRACAAHFLASTYKRCSQNGGACFQFVAGKCASACIPDLVPAIHSLCDMLPRTVSYVRMTRQQ